jgi:hypothetical protein
MDGEKMSTLAASFAVGAHSRPPSLSRWAPGAMVGYFLFSCRIDAPTAATSGHYEVHITRTCYFYCFLSLALSFYFPYQA